MVAATPAADRGEQAEFLPQTQENLTNDIIYRKEIPKRSVEFLVWAV